VIEQDDAAVPPAAEPASGELVIRRSTPADDGERDRFVLAQPRATFFHQSGWRRMVEKVYEHQPVELVAHRDQELVGVLPMMLCRGILGRANLVSMPYAVYGGPVGVDRAVEESLVQEAVKIAQGMRVGHLELRHLHDPGDDLVASDLYWTFIRELPAKEEDVLAQMPKKARAEARKARKKFGLELGQGLWYVDDLVRLFLENKHGLGSPALPARHFRAVLAEFEGRAFIHIVRQNRRPLSAVLSLAFGDTLIAYYAGTEAGADRSFKASNFMYMALQEWAVRRGFRTFDFCRSRADSGAFAFKRHQGFEPRPLQYRYHLVKNRKLPSFTPSNPRTRLMRSTWAKLPRWLVRRGSDRLARYLP